MPALMISRLLHRQLQGNPKKPFAPLPLFFCWNLLSNLAEMKAVRFLLLAVGVAAAMTASAQLTKETTKQLRKVEDTLKQQSYKMVNDTRASERFVADSAFIKTLVRALKAPYSFDYPFDSLKAVSHIYSQDSAIRIFTWQFMRDETYFRQRGAIQVKTADGSLK